MEKKHKNRKKMMVWVIIILIFLRFVVFCNAYKKTSAAYCLTEKFDTELSILGQWIHAQAINDQRIREAVTTPAVMKFWCEQPTAPTGGSCLRCDQFFSNIVQTNRKCTAFYVRSRFMSDHKNNCKDDKRCENFRDFTNKVVVIDKTNGQKEYKFTEFVSKKERSMNQ